jgi:hypothetical protein
MDQVEAKVAESAAEKQVPNRFQTGSSPQEAARQLEEIVTGWGKQPRPVQLLKALCRLVADSDSGGVDGFSALELVDAVQKSGVTDWGGDADPDRFRKLVNRNWNDLEKIWAEHLPGIIERFADLDVKLIPELIRKEGGGRGHPTRYWLKFSPADDVVGESRKRQAPVPPGGVRYYTEEITSAKRLGWLSKRGFLLIGWRAKLFIGVLMAVVFAILAMMVILWFGVVAAPSTVKSISSVLSLGLFAGGAWFLMRPFVELVNNHIALAPWWMQKATSGYDDRLVELRRMDDVSANVIYLTRYAGKCPLCDGNVWITSGRREFPGRLVGRCGRAPNEHVFSFDHVLRIGKPLR